jgi:putative membrane protein (TIGR04086 family)
MIKISDESTSYGSSIARILKGTMFSIVITIVLLIAFSTLLAYSSIKESTIPVVVLVITGISILIGSQISTRNIKKNGIINGTLIGLIYILLIYILSGIIGKNFSLNLYSVIMIIISMIMGGLGGIIGVNMK